MRILEARGRLEFEVEAAVSRPLNDSDNARELTGLANAFIGGCHGHHSSLLNPSAALFLHSPRQSTPHVLNVSTSYFYCFKF